MSRPLSLFSPCSLICPNQRARNRELRAEADAMLRPIDALGVSTRAQNVLIGLGCQIVGEVIARGRQGLDDAKGAGPIVAAEVHAAIERMGLKLPYRGTVDTSNLAQGATEA